jgi:hypothetical protein
VTSEAGNSPGEGTKPVDVVAAVRQVLGDSLGFLYPACLRVAARLNIADHLVDGPKSAAELAGLTGVSAGHLHRVLRYLATRSVFHEEPDGTFRLTTAAGLLKSDCPLNLRSLVLLFTGPAYWLPTGRLEAALYRGGTVFDEVFGAQFFDRLPDEPAFAELFYTAMAALSAVEQGPIAQAYGFPATGTVVDIAGGRGGMLAAVLRANPGLHGILCDLPPVLERHQLTEFVADGRARVQVADFFEAVPAGAEFYLLKRILHDKSDRDCARILRVCRAAMRGGARLLIIDPLLTTTDVAVPIAVSDIVMLTVFEGRERTESELMSLLDEAGLKLVRVISTGTALSILEASVAVTDRDL